MESVFIRMLSGREPAVLISEDPDHAAILEPCPSAEGHTVVFPKKVTDAFFGLEDAEMARLMAYCGRIARALEREVSCDKVAVVVYGLKVRHAHVHLIPARGVPGEIALDKPRPPADPAVLERLAGRIRTRLQAA